MTSSPTPETMELRAGSLGNNDIYRPARGAQLAALCGILARWGAARYRHRPPTVYQPGSHKYDTRLVVIEGDDLLGLKTRANSSPSVSRSIGNVFGKNNPELEKIIKPKPIVARSTEHIINDDGGNELWLTFEPDLLENTDDDLPDKDDSLAVYRERQDIQTMLENATSRLDLNENYQPGILLIRFEPEAIIPTRDIEALQYEFRRQKALPIPISLGALAVPSWMKGSS